MQVELVQVGVGAIVGELNGHLKVGPSDGLLAYRAGHPNAVPRPRPMMLAPWEAIRLEQLTNSVTEDGLILHLAALGTRPQIERRANGESTHARC